MTRMLDEAVGELRKLPAPDQNALATLIFAHLSDPSPTYTLTDEQVVEVKRRQAALKTGKTQHAPEEDVAALWARCGL